MNNKHYETCKEILGRLISLDDRELLENYLDGIKTNNVLLPEQATKLYNLFRKYCTQK